MKVLVYGWFNRNNLGDDLFIEAYRYLFPQLELIFVDHITAFDLIGIDAVFFGGGSFLLTPPEITNEALHKLQSIPIFYLGIGVEVEIDPVHLQLLKQAKLIATRSIDQVERLKLINYNVQFIPDLVYCLQSKLKLACKLDRSVLILPNINVVPQRSDPHWKHTAWQYFKSEMSQFLDWLVDNNYHPTFYALGRSLEANDQWAAAELIAQMDKRHQRYLVNYQANNFAEITEFVSQYQTVITQRFHGIVLSEMTRTPYINIYHHDKLKYSSPGEGDFMSYFACSKQSLIASFQKIKKMKFNENLPIQSAIFETFNKEIINILKK